MAELIVKVRTKLGDLNLTDSTDSDNPPWGFKNLAKLGKVVVGLTKDELKEFPIRGIDDSMEVLGKQSGWRRGQVIPKTALANTVAFFRHYIGYLTNWLSPRNFFRG